MLVSQNTPSRAVTNLTCLYTEIVFTEIYLPKSKPFIVGILYIRPDKIDFANISNI